MTEPSLSALSPLDGRYAAQVQEVSAIFSEAALIRYRIRVEAMWLAHLAAEPAITELRGLADAAAAELLRQALQEALDVLRGDAEAVVGGSAGDRECSLDAVEAEHVLAIGQRSFR